MKDSKQTTKNEEGLPTLTSKDEGSRFIEEDLLRYSVILARISWNLAHLFLFLSCLFLEEKL